MLDPLLSGLDSVLYALDTPGALARGVLGGRPGDRLSGRELLTEWGWTAPNDPNKWEGADFAGFGADVLLDPLNLVPMGALAGALGLSKARKAAKLADEFVPVEAANALEAVSQAAPTGGLLPYSAASPANPQRLGLPAPAETLALPAPEPMWHSRLNRAVQGLEGKNVNLGNLRKRLEKSGNVSPEEMDWVLGGLLAKSGTIPKGALGRVVDEKGIKLHEVIREGDAPDIMFEWNGPIPDIEEIAEMRGNLESRVRHLREANEGPYPTARITALELAIDDLDQLSAAMETQTFSQAAPHTLTSATATMLGGSIDQATEGLGTRWKQYATPGGKNYKELLLRIPEEGMPYRKDARFRETFLSGHWDESNVLAHIRFDERTIAGERTLFVQEIQSDWHQKGARFGYGGDHVPLSIKRRPGQDGEFGEIFDVVGSDGVEYGIISEDPYSGTFGAATVKGFGIRKVDWLREEGDKVVTKRFGSKEEALEALDEASLPRSKPNAVVNAPFKGKKWVELAAKRIARYASDNGFDRIAWNNGEMARAMTGGKLSGHQQFYDKTLPGVFKKVLGKDAEFDPVEMAHFRNIVPSFRLPQKTKKKLSLSSMPMLATLPAAAGLGLLDNEDL